MTLILASQSPQRKKILEEMGLNFKCIPAHIDEHHGGYTALHSIVKSIALRKAQAVAKAHPSDWVIGSDSMVLLSDGQVATKPEGIKEAREMLKKYQGSYCHVYSGIAMINLSLEKKHVGYEKTSIHFLNFSDEQMEDYLDSGGWEGRSGSLTIEDSGDWVKKIDGDYWNIVGLPVNSLKRMLKMAQLV